MNTNKQTTFTFPKFTRYFTLIMGIAIICFFIFFIFTKIDSNTSTFKKIVPFIIIFLAFDSVSRNVLSLNKVKIYDKHISFTFLLKKNVNINWEDIKKIESVTNKLRYFIINYEIDNTAKKFIYPMSFPNTIEILNLIKEFAPAAEFDDFAGSLIIEKKE
jgi:hypothetical protein